MIYLDNAASTPLYPEVIEMMTKSLLNDFANPSSAHKLGRDLQNEIMQIQSNQKKIIGADTKDYFYFVSSATEANSTIIKGVQYTLGDGIFFSRADHNSVVAPLDLIKKNEVHLFDFKLKKNGEIDLEELDKKIDNLKDFKMRLAVLSLVNNQSGNINPVNLVAQKLKSKFPQIHIHIDAVQGIGKIPYKITKDIDSLVFAAHKLGGPKGIAGLYLNKNHKISPLIIGGGQQDNFRSGTEAITLIKAFGKATQVSVENSVFQFEKLTKLQEKIKFALKAEIEEIQFPFENVSPYILTFIVPRIPSDVLLRHLETKEVYLASTSACSSRIKAFNPTLAALNLPEKFHKNVLRLSLSQLTSESEIDEFLKIFKTLWNDIKYLMK